MARGSALGEWRSGRCVSIVSWPDRIELALRTAAGTAYAMLPGGPAGTMCSESLWVANPELPLLCLPGPYQNVGAQEQRGLCSGVRDLAGASPYGARRWPFPTAIYWLEIPHAPFAGGEASRAVWGAPAASFARGSLCPFLVTPQQSDSIQRHLLVAANGTRARCATRPSALFEWADEEADP